MKPTVGLDYAPSGSLAGLDDGAGRVTQTVYPCEASGHIAGSLDTYVAWFPWTVGVAAARTTHLDLFNAVGSGRVLRIRDIRAVPDIATAVTGVGFRWEVLRTSAVGTGGTAITPQKLDTAHANLPGQITARQKPTGGATTSALLFGLSVHGEETQAAAQLMQGLNILGGDDPIVLREGYGLKLDQVTNSVAGNFGWVVTFTVEA